MTIDVETDRVAKQIGGMTLLHSTECEIAGIKTTYLMYELQIAPAPPAAYISPIVSVLGYIIVSAPKRTIIGIITSQLRTPPANIKEAILAPQI